MLDKVEVLDKVTRRKKTVAVRCHQGVKTDKIHHIKKNEDIFTRSIKSCTPMRVKMPCVYNGQKVRYRNG